MQSGRVAEQMGRQGSDLARQLQLLGVGPLLKHRNAIADKRIDRNLGFLQHELARLDLGQIEDVVDDSQQMTASVLDLVEFVTLL